MDYWWKYWAGLLWNIIVQNTTNIFEWNNSLNWINTWEDADVS